MENTTTPPEDRPAGRWPIAAYEHIADDGIGAEKLSASAVAPLVAAARGYESLTPAGLKDAANRLRIGALNGRSGIQFKSIVGRNGALMLPWHGPATARRSITGRRPMPTVPQFRPVDPRVDPDTGRVVKYEFLAGAPTTLDVHPATPPGWLDHTPTAVITEGVLKGDAVLTGLLRANGIPDADLRFDGTGDPINRLRGLLQGLPPDAHQLVVSLIGVAGWHRHPEWAQIDLTGRTVLIGFDGDVRSNFNVWTQAAKLWRHLAAASATPALLDIGDSGSGPGHAPAGLDDYLASIGSCPSLLRRAQAEMPPAPDRGRPEPAPGDWRINEQTRCAEEFVVTRAGHSWAGDWEPRTRLAGRVQGILTRRSVSDREAATGQLDPDAEAIPGSTTVRPCR